MPVPEQIRQALFPLKFISPYDGFIFTDILAKFIFKKDIGRRTYMWGKLALNNLFFIASLQLSGKQRNGQ